MACQELSKSEDYMDGVSGVSTASSLSTSSDDSSNVLLVEPRQVMQDDTSCPPSLESGHHMLARTQSCDLAEVKAVRVFDMRTVRHLSYGREYRLKCRSMSEPDIASEVSSYFNVELSRVHVIEQASRSEGARLMTEVVVVPSAVQINGSLNVLVDFFTDIWPQQTLCIRFSLSATLVQIIPTLEQELQYPRLCFCRNGLMLPKDRTIQTLGLSPFDRVQLVHSQTKIVQFQHQPRSDAEFIFRMNVDTTWSIRQVKDAGLEEFGDFVPEKCKGSVLHLVSSGVLLQDDQCVGLWLGRSREESLEVHFSNKEAIAVILKFKDGRKKCTKQIIVPIDCSTKALRNLIGRKLKIDPKAVKLVIHDVRVDECESLQDTLYNGCVISVGIKKRKRLRIKNPQTENEMSVEMYLLECVYYLKKKVAETMGLEPLNFRLYCRGIEMKEKYLLMNYALKNNMQLTMTVYERRLLVYVRIVFKHIRQSVIIDHPNKTTVGDLLRYCGHRHDYHSGYSRAIYGNRCLDTGKTLEEEGVESKMTVAIVHFEKSEHLREGLIPLFEVRPDGQVNHEHAAVVSGVLCKVTGPTRHIQEGPSVTWNNGPVPTGIHLFKDQFGGPKQTAKNLKIEKPESPKRKEFKLTVKERQCLLDKFLPQAREVCQRREISICQGELASGDSDITRVKELYRTRGSRVKQARKSSNPTFYLSSADDEMDTDGSKKPGICPGTRHQDSKQGHGSSKQGPSHSGKVYIWQYESRNELDSCEKEDRGNFKDESPEKEYGSKIIEPIDVVVNSNPVSDNDSEGAGGVFSAFKPRSPKKSRDELYKSTNKLPVAVNGENPMQTNDLDSKDAHKSSSSEHLPHVQHCFATSQIRGGSDSGIALDDIRGLEHVCLPYPYQMCPYLARLHRQMMPRRRTRTTGDIETGNVMVPALPSRDLHHVSTFPQLAQRDTDDFLNTSGVTANMLRFISEHAIRHWRQLVRTLGLSESRIDSCAQNHRDNIQEAAYQALIAWKRQTGREGTRDKMLHALEAVGLKNIAEKFNGYHTA